MSERLVEAVHQALAQLAIPSISYALFDTHSVTATGHVARDGPSLPDSTILRIGSISKCFVSLAAMREVQAGRLDLDADIDRYLGRFALTGEDAATPLTLRQLLSHRSGLTREAARGHYLSDADVPLAETVDSLRQARRKVAPGTYRYSNAGFALAGACVEAASCLPYPDYLAEAILAPLGMNDTRLGIGLVERRRLAPARMWSESGDRKAPIFNLGSAPAGNIVATIDDLAAFGQALLGSAILPRETLEAMWQVPDGAATGYASGFMVGDLAGQRTIGHGGVVYGYASEMMLLPDAGLGIAMVATLDAVNDVVMRLCRYGLQVALAARGKCELPTPPAADDYAGPCRLRRDLLRGEAPASAAARHARIGSYGPPFLPTRLTLRDGRLSCVMEEFFTHDCVPIDDNRYRLGPGMYEDEILQLDVRSAAGRPAIGVGEMILERLD